MGGGPARGPGVYGALLPWALACAALASAHCSTPSECTSHEQCQPDELCLDNQCVASEGRACGVETPCPDGQHCCRGTCGARRCCLLDSDCTDGYCENNRCQDGVRPDCTVTGCAQGVCDTETGACVECTLQADCPEPLVCGVDRTCVEQARDCTTSLCAQPQLPDFCSATEGCRGCVAGGGECGDQVCSDGACVQCADGTCPGGLVCEDIDDAGPGGNVCTVPLGARCTTNAHCGNKVCRVEVHPEFGNITTCQACTGPDQCSLGWTCNVASGRCEANEPECTHDRECNPPLDICEAGRCVPGCLKGTCAEGQACNVRSGRCFMVGGSHRPIGQACTTHGECITGACWHANVFGLSAHICSKACAQTTDCPDGAVCLEQGDAALCVPRVMLESSFPAPRPRFSDAVGATCDSLAEEGHVVDLDCLSGYCAPSVQLGAPACMEMCGRDRDCGVGQICSPGWPIASDNDGNGVLAPQEVHSYTALCHAGWGHIGPNLDCGTAFGGAVNPSDHMRCRSGWCVQTPDLTRPAHCAEGCCTPQDCDPSRPVCKPIDVFDGIREAGDPAPLAYQKVCLWREYDGVGEGTLDIGAPCVSDSQCRSEICASAQAGGPKVCTHTCCTNDDCAGYDFAPICRKPFTYPSILEDSGYSAVRTSLGRQLRTGAGQGHVGAMTTLCLPP